MPTKRPSPQELFDRFGGVFPLKPNYVRRLYQDGGRLYGGKPGASYRSRDRMYLPERWICSTSTTMNTPPIAGEGLSVLDQAGPAITLKQLIEADPEAALGPRRLAAHGPEFRVLLKILDAAEPIPFQFHASDAQVRRRPELFPGQRFGKDEAYFFLEAPKGPVPYTHAGLWPDVTLRDLKQAAAKGGDYLLELSPVVLQRFGEGFHTPAGMIHRPGTALTLEVQQPSDVYVLLEDVCAGRRLAPAEQHPGFERLDDSYAFCDMDVSRRPDVVDAHRLIPSATGRDVGRANSEDWIFPPSASRNFSGKRLRVRRRDLIVDDEPMAVFIWRGSGQLGGRPFKAGDEFFIAHQAAARGVAVQADEPVEMYCLFAAVAE